MKPVYDDPRRNVPMFEAAFDEGGLDWALIGGLAAIVRRATGRETVDADFVVSGIGDLENRLKNLAGGRCRILREPDGSPYLIQGETQDGMHFDIYIAEIPFEKAVLSTKDQNHIASAEAVIVYKLMAMRPVDVDDIRSILAVHPGLEGLDADFIEKWAEECGVLDRWRAFAGGAG